MSYTIWDYVDENGVNTIKEWVRTLGPDRPKLEAKLNMLRTAGADLAPRLLSRTRSPHILKLRFFGKSKVPWRPMLCKGPINADSEFTLLLGAYEKGMRLVPPEADRDAEQLRRKVITDPANRRRLHERLK